MVQIHKIFEDLAYEASGRPCESCTLPRAAVSLATARGTTDWLQGAHAERSEVGGGEDAFSMGFVVLEQILIGGKEGRRDSGAPRTRGTRRRLQRPGLRPRSRSRLASVEACTLLVNHADDDWAWRLSLSRLPAPTRPLATRAKDTDSVLGRARLMRKHPQEVLPSMAAADEPAGQKGDRKEDRHLPPSLRLPSDTCFDVTSPPPPRDTVNPSAPPPRLLAMGERVSSKRGSR